MEGEGEAEEEYPSHLAAAVAAEAEEVVGYLLHPAVVEVEAAEEGEAEQP